MVITRSLELLPRQVKTSVSPGKQQGRKKHVIGNHNLALFHILTIQSIQNRQYCQQLFLHRFAVFSGQQLPIKRKQGGKNTAFQSDLSPCPTVAGMEILKQLIPDP